MHVAFPWNSRQHSYFIFTGTFEHAPNTWGCVLICTRLHEVCGLVRAAWLKEGAAHDWWLNLITARRIRKCQVRFIESNCGLESSRQVKFSSYLKIFHSCPPSRAMPPAWRLYGCPHLWHNPAVRDNAPRRKGWSCAHTLSVVSIDVVLACTFGVC